MNAKLHILFCGLACIVLTGCTKNSTPETISGRYYQGDGLGYNLDLTLSDDGTFSCDWTGCLGHYGQTDGTWVREKNSIELTANSASGMFEDEPISDLLLTTVGGERRLVFASDSDLLNDVEMLTAFSFGRYPETPGGG